MKIVVIKIGNSNILSIFSFLSFSFLLSFFIFKFDSDSVFDTIWLGKLLLFSPLLLLPSWLVCFSSVIFEIFITSVSLFFKSLGSFLKLILRPLKYICWANKADEPMGIHKKTYKMKSRNIWTTLYICLDLSISKKSKVYNNNKNKELKTKQIIEEHLNP